MDNRAGEMEVFATAAELGSFSSAGRRLGLSPSAVSKLVTRIEDRQHTPASALDAPCDPDTGGRNLSRQSKAHSGRHKRDGADRRKRWQGGASWPLRVNATLGFGERYLLPLAPEFLSLYPEVELDISLTDGVISLIEERTDIAIRSGAMEDSALKARKLLEVRRMIVASPPISKKYGAPAKPQDLARHNCFSFNFNRNLNEWPFRNPDTDEVYRLPVSGNASVNSGMAMRRLCLSGFGLGRVGEFHVRPDIDAGLLVPVLEDYNPQDLEVIHAVYAGHEHLAARVRAFIDFVADKVAA